MGKNTEQLHGAFAFASNSPGTPTGYGTQGAQLIERMLRHGLKVASLSNFGHEGTISTIKVGKHTIPHYPKGFTQYSADVIPQWVNHYDASHKERTALFTLYDVWVYEQGADTFRLNGEPMDIVSWVPLDRVAVEPSNGLQVA